MAKIDYLIHAPNEGASLSLTPYAHIWLSQHSGFKKDGNSYIALSPQLIGDDEIDYHVDDLIKQLERVRKNAKRALAKAQKR